MSAPRFPSAASAPIARPMQRVPDHRRMDDEELETVWDGTMGRQGASLTRGGGSALHPRNLEGF